MEALAEFASLYGWPIGLVVWISIGLLKLFQEQGPKVIHNYQSRKADQEEHVQELETRRVRHEELLALAAAGSRTYTEEQLTHHLAEVYQEFQETNKFIREIAFQRMDEINMKLDQLLVDARVFSDLAEKVAEIRMYVRSIDKSLGQRGESLDYDTTYLERAKDFLSSTNETNPPKSEHSK